MKQHKLSAAKRFGKPVLFGILLAGLAAAFMNRQLFLADVAGLREQERTRHQDKLLQVLEGRQRQMDKLQEERGEEARPAD